VQRLQRRQRLSNVDEFLLLLEKERVRVSKTANKQRERIEIRFDTISSELFFCEIIRVLRVAEMVASTTKERERERERERDFLDWDFAPPLSALPHKNETSS